MKDKIKKIIGVLEPEKLGFYLVVLISTILLTVKLGEFISSKLPDDNVKYYDYVEPNFDQYRVD
jgi:hypothetical protein